MKKVLAILAFGLILSGCAARHHEREAAARGALIGAAGGAIVSSIAGKDPLAGAAIGAAGGAAVGLITAEGKQRRINRDRHGRAYWIDDHGRWRYVSDRRD